MGASVFQAAALALRAMAANEAMVLKVIRSLDFQTDGAKTADALRALAKELDSKAEDELAALVGGFEIAEMVQTPFQANERLRKQLLRAG